MQLFFPSIDKLESFTHRLKNLSKDNACEHCNKNDQWVSHGYVYKQLSMHRRKPVGKRILCSNRFRYSGCGRTRQLYLHDIIPKRRYTLQVLTAFIFHLVNGSTVTQAWQYARHNSNDPRHAWRWLKDLHTQLHRFRTLLSRQAHPEPPPFTFPRRLCRRLQVLLPSLYQLDKYFSLSALQLHQQQACF